MPRALRHGRWARMPGVVPWWRGWHGGWRDVWWTGQARRRRATRGHRGGRRLGWRPRGVARDVRGDAAGYRRVLRRRPAPVTWQRGAARRPPGGIDRPRGRPRHRWRHAAPGQRARRAGRHGLLDRRRRPARRARGRPGPVRRPADRPCPAIPGGERGPARHRGRAVRARLRRRLRPARGEGGGRHRPRPVAIDGGSGRHAWRRHRLGGGRPGARPGGHGRRHRRIHAPPLCRLASALAAGAAGGGRAPRPGRRAALRRDQDLVPRLQAAHPDPPHRAQAGDPAGGFPSRLCRDAGARPGGGPRARRRPDAQRHALLPRRGGLRRAAPRGDRPPARGAQARAAAAHLGRGLRDGRGGLLHRHDHRRVRELGHRPVMGEDPRLRHRRQGAGDRARRPLPVRHRRRRGRRPAREVLHP